jgi:hypothetical protein
MMWHPDRAPGWHDPWWSSWHTLVPLLLLLILGGLVIWLALRLNKLQTANAAGAAPDGVAGAAPSPVAVDAALTTARMRYANGEMDRDTFLAISGDLSGAPSAPTADPTTVEADPSASVGDEGIDEA